MAGFGERKREGEGVFTIDTFYFVSIMLLYIDTLAYLSTSFCD